MDTICDKIVVLLWAAYGAGVFTVIFVVLWARAKVSREFRKTAEPVEF